MLRLILKSLTYYWRTNVGVLLAVIAATAVMAGALVVGDSVDHSLKLRVQSRLGGTELALIAGDRFFTEALAKRAADKLEASTAAVLHVRGMVANSDDTKRANKVELMGVDAGFYLVAAENDPFKKGEDAGLVINEALAERVGVKVGDEVLLRIAKPALMSREIALTPEADMSIGFRLKVEAIANQSQAGDFSLRADQVSALNGFVRLRWLQEQLGRGGQANMLLVGSGVKVEISEEKANEAVRESLQVGDLGLEVRSLVEKDLLELRSGRVFIDEAIGDAAVESGKGAVGVLTYFVNRLRAGEKQTPYSMVTAMSRSDGGNSLVPSGMADDEIIINQWLADDLDVGKGDLVEVDYFVVSSGRKLVERTAEFRVRAVVAIEGLAGDPELMPDFPGLAKVDNCRDWEVGIPIDLDAIREKDEDYWDSYRGTPKAFITLEAGQEIWANRYGNLTAVRYSLKENSSEQVTKKLLGMVDPAEAGLFFQPIREMGVKASGEGTDFGQLFVGFSMFIIAAALVLLGLLFVFGVEKRCGQIGLLFAVGFKAGQIKLMFLIEAMVLTLIGTFFGIMAGLLYTKAMVYGLGSIWRVAISSSRIVFYVELRTLLIAALAAFVVCLVAIWFGFRKQLRRSARELLDENLEWQFLKAKSLSKGRFGLIAAGCSAAAAVMLLVFSARGDEGISVGAFFGAGGLLLIAAIIFTHALLKILADSEIRPARSIVSLAWRNSLRRRGRSLAVVAMLAFGVFIVISVGANRHDPLADRKGLLAGTGGICFDG